MVYLFIACLQCKLAILQLLPVHLIQLVLSHQQQAAISGRKVGAILKRSSQWSDTEWFCCTMVPRADQIPVSRSRITLE